MSQAVLSVRVSETDKEDFEAFCEQVGMNVSVAINMFIKNVIQRQKLPFAVKAKHDPFYSEYNQQILRQSIAQLELGKGKEHELIEVD